MLIVLASAQPPARVDAAWAFNGLCLRGAGIPAYTALMHAAVAAFMVADAETILFMLVMEPSFTTGPCTGRLHPHATIFLEMSFVTALLHQLEKLSKTSVVLCVEKITSCLSV